MFVFVVGERYRAEQAAVRLGAGICSKNSQSGTVEINSKCNMRAYEMLAMQKKRGCGMQRSRCGQADGTLILF